MKLRKFCKVFTGDSSESIVSEYNSFMERNYSIIVESEQAGFDNSGRLVTIVLLYKAYEEKV